MPALMMCEYSDLELKYAAVIHTAMNDREDGKDVGQEVSDALTKLWDSMTSEQQQRIQKYLDDTYVPEVMAMFDCAVEIGSSKMPRRRVPLFRKYKE